MAQAISERLLERALGPVDLSYAYQKMDAVSRQLAAEDRARKQEAAKNYYTEVASMNKERAGVRAIDTPEVSNMYKQWAENEKKLSKSPNLITKNPEEYGRIKSESDALYSKLLTTIRTSKEIAKQEQQDYAKIADPKNIDNYEPDAAVAYKQFVINQPVSAIIANGTNDITKYYAKEINGKEFYTKLNQFIPTQGVQKGYQFTDPSYKDAYGRTRQVKFGDMPIDAKIKNVVVENLISNFGRRADTFANQQLSNAIATKEFDKVVNEYNKFYDPANPEGFKKYNLPEVKALKFDGAMPKTELFANFIAAKEFLARKPIPQYGQPKLDEIAKMKLSDTFALRRALTLKNAEKATKELNIYSPQAEIEDIANTPLGQDARAKAINFTSNYNSRFSGEKIYPFVAAEATAFEGTPYETALDIIREKFDPKGKLNIIITAEDSQAVAREKRNKLASLINAENKNYGIPAVTPQDITEGKVFIKQTFGTDGKSTVVAYPIRNKQAVTELSNGVILSQMTPEQKRQYVQTGFSGGQAQAKPKTVQQTAGKKNIKGF
jgi:hypothetical protein